jgi:hypothetical protein
MYLLNLLFLVFFKGTNTEAHPTVKELTGKGVPA